MAAYRTGFVLVFLLFISFGAGAQIDRYMVFFKDKTGTPYTIDHPEKFLTGKSIARRARQSIPIVEQDLPPVPNYAVQIRNKGAKTFYSSRWMNGVLCEIEKDSVSKISALPFVDSVVYVAPGNKLSGGRLKRLKNKKSTADAGTTAPQLRQLGMDVMHSDGFHGENISIAVLDGGFSGVDSAPAFQSLASLHQIKMTFNFVVNMTNVFQTCGDCDHGTEVLSILAVNTDTYTGAAWAADYYLFVTEDVSSEYRIEEYNWLFGAEKADSVGVDIISTSLGYNEFDDASMNYIPADMNGKRAVTSRAASFALSKGIVVVVSAGNEGFAKWHIITSPADADGVLACGAVSIGGGLAPFSSVGPTSDGRIKPDVVALGVANPIITPGGSAGTNSGTSFSTPLVAGFAAGVIQAFPSLTAEQVYQAITRSANRASAPDNNYGYGVPFFPAVKSYIEKSDTLSIYPNPSDTGKVNVKFNYQYGDATVYFYDIFGRLMSQHTVTIDPEHDPVELDVSGLPNGVYIIMIKNSMLTRAFRFVKSG